MDLNLYIFKNRRSGEYWIEKGKTTPNRTKATKFNSDSASRFYRTVAHPNKWIKEKE